MGIFIMPNRHRSSASLLQRWLDNADTPTLADKSLPHWYIPYEFIRSGYRKPNSSVLRSLFTAHNETLNIWLHLGGFFVHSALNLWWCFGPQGWYFQLESGESRLIG